MAFNRTVLGRKILAGGETTGFVQSITRPGRGGGGDYLSDIHRPARDLCKKLALEFRHSGGMTESSPAIHRQV